MTELPRKVHIIGICGVATGALAVAMQDRGVQVTGSDVGFFPPVSTELEKHGIDFYPGWHPEKIQANMPDIVIIGTASGSQNPETAFVKKSNIPIYSFAEAIGKYFTRTNNIVCVGTWGKTSSSALLSFILESNAYDPSYMFGGISLSHRMSAKLGDSDWAVFEGDEYKSSPTDTTAKFFYYKPTHLLLSAISWDHADLYPTEQSFFDVFHRLLNSIPNNNFIVACKDNKRVMDTINVYKGNIVFYGKADSEHYIHGYENNKVYMYSEVKQDENGLDFTISQGKNSWSIHSPMIGIYQVENITGCFAMAHTIGISADGIVKAINDFKGLKRRLEKRSDGKIKVIDDIAHSPEKAKSAIESLRNICKGKLIVVFEPNSGNRQREILSKYDHAFDLADLVIIPRLTKLKVSNDENHRPIEGDELAQYISKTQKNTVYLDDDNTLIEKLKAESKPGDIIAFLGSHGFRNMIEETVQSAKGKVQS